MRHNCVNFVFLQVGVGILNVTYFYFDLFIETSEPNVIFNSYLKFDPYSFKCIIAY